MLLTIRLMAEPFSWNVVVVGAWNTAILSPDGVRRRLFDLPDGTPIELEVQVDRPGPFRIGHEGLVVIPIASRLEVATRTSTPESLERACRLCQRALQILPETPVSGVGVNVRYRFDELPDQILDLIRAPIDVELADADFQVQGGITKRSITLTPGLVNVEITQSQAINKLEFNFHRDSTAPAELSDWLGRVQEFIALSDRLANVVGAGDVRREIHA
jgi:hypothetical protein